MVVTQTFNIDFFAFDLAQDKTNDDGGGAMIVKRSIFYRMREERVEREREN